MSNISDKQDSTEKLLILLRHDTNENQHLKKPTKEDLPPPEEDNQPTPECNYSDVLQLSLGMTQNKTKKIG